MPFDTSTPKRESNFKKALYLNLKDPGFRIVRLLQPENYLKVETHWINNASIVCPGEGCPICENNKRLAIEYSANKAFRNQKDWRPTVQRFLVNVFDRTPVKVCPNCGLENYRLGNAFPNMCSCNTVITGVVAQPSNKVKVLAKGKTLFDDFNAAETTVNLDLDGNELVNPSISSFDFTLSVNPTESTHPVKAEKNWNRNDVVEYNEEDLFDLDNCVIRLTVDELKEFIRGVSLRDIFAARRNDTLMDQAEETASKTSEELEKMAKELFG
jgi:hypothetical protein